MSAKCKRAAEKATLMMHGKLLRRVIHGHRWAGHNPPSAHKAWRNAVKKQGRIAKITSSGKTLDQPGRL